jgi:DNA-binding LacI/PurR family transcriptional regulator
MLRLTPTREVLEALRRARLPTVLIHSNRLQFDPPIIGNVVPDQRAIGDQLAMWLRGLKHARGRSRKPRVVVVAMPKERDADEFPRSDAVQQASIRNDRIERVCAVLGKTEPDVTVEDYSFRHAFRVVSDFPSAEAYICFSDQLAVGIKHVLLAQGQDVEHRIVGFDNSRVAESENVSSFAQRLEDVGDAAVSLLLRQFRSREPVGPFEEVELKMDLILRG